MQDIERAEPRLMTTLGLESSRKTLVLRPLCIDWFHKCIDLSIGRPSLPSDFSADGLSTREPMICPQPTTPVSSCRVRDSSHNISAWKSGTLRQAPHLL